MSVRVRRGFLFDPNKCIGCGACVLACTIENELAFGESWRSIFHFNESHIPQAPVFHLSLACNHCGQAPCSAGCPVGAFRRDLATGTLLIDTDRCIGCKYCYWVCPFDAPHFDQKAGIMKKCTLCQPRLQQGNDPACVELCPVDALRYGELPVEESILPPGFPMDDVKPAIAFRPLNPVPNKEEAERTPLGLLSEFWQASRSSTIKQVTFAEEWPLWLFTVIVPFLIAWGSAYGLSGTAFSVAAFGGLTLLALGSSLLHLGKPLSAYRAIRNWKHSWLSREIVFLLLFLGAIGALVVGRFSLPVRVAIPILGIATLFSVDRLYQKAESRNLNWDSAQTLYTGVLYFFALNSWWETATYVLMAKMLLFARSRFFGERQNLRLTAPWAAIRLIVGFFLPPLLWYLNPASRFMNGLALALLLIGEAIDRLRFYLELEFQSPTREMGRELKSFVKK